MVPVRSSSLSFVHQNAHRAVRFITPIFLHAGFIHILLNLLAQLTLSAQVCHAVDLGFHC